jgi:hypothetical protein
MPVGMPLELSSEYGAVPPEIVACAENWEYCVIDVVLRIPTAGPDATALLAAETEM